MEETQEHQDNSKFRVNRDLIVSIDRKNQDLELQELDITVYDHSTLKLGIINQVKGVLDEDNADTKEEGEIKDDGDVKSKVKNVKKVEFKDPFLFLEKYLKLQAELNEKRYNYKKKTYDSPVGPDSNSKEITTENTDVPVTPEKPAVNEKLPVKRKRKNSCPLKIKQKKSPTISEPETDELTNNEDYSSGSEYVPNYDDLTDDEYSANKYKKKATKNRKQPISEDSDSSWLSSEDECSSRKSKKELDDGDLDIYMKRTKSLLPLDKGNCVHVDESYRVPTHIWKKLFEYQRNGVRWLWQLHKDSFGGILGDEMGLGKTIQMISFLAGLHFSDEKDVEFNCHGLGPTIIVCPTTIMHQWVREFHNWFPQIRVAILHDSGTFSGDDRTDLIKSISLKTKGILITSYAGLFMNHTAILDCPWHYVILDEGHKIRNPDAQITHVCKSFDTSHKIILSGSPMQNNLKELWSLFDFIIPGKLGPLHVFNAAFVTPIIQGGYVNASKFQAMAAFKCATVLRETIKPYLLRRSKMEVDIQLPGKKDQVLICQFTDYQREAYLAFLKTLDVDYVSKNKGRLFGALITLRNICNHPDIYTSQFHDHYDVNHTMFGAEKGNEDDYGYWKRSGKMTVLAHLLKHWNKVGGRKVLLFTQGIKMMLIIENFIQRSGYKYLKLDGKIAIGARQPLIDKFNNDISYFIMLLTTRVGGLGVNLTGANRVIIFDPDWNPATDIQARERAWRIGQRKDVSIYRLITTGTIEEKIYHRQIFKEFLSNKILKNPKQRRFFKSHDLMELFTLNETVKGGTSETAAIFAGTGSEIKYDPTASSRFAMKTTADTPQHPEIVFSQRKYEEMRKIAQAMSKRITELVNEKSNISAESKQDSLKPEEQSSSGSIYGPDGLLISKAVENIQEKIIDINGANKSNIEESRSNNNNELQSNLNQDREHYGRENECENNKIKVNASNSKLVVYCEASTSGENSLCLNNDSQENFFKHSDSESDYEMTFADMLGNKKIVKKQSDRKEENIPNEPKMKLKINKDILKEKKTKKKNKKKHKSEFAKFEGVVIPHLVKCRRFKENKDEEMFKNQDEYILHKLLKKSGIDTAMKHDVIMEEGPSDYAIVEEEASTIAESAVKAIQQEYNQSRQEKQSKNPLMQEIMNKLRERNLQGFANGPNSKILLSELISYLNSMGGTTSTKQLIEYFSEKVDSGQSPIFKKLLGSIATFYRAPDSYGYWTLKEEFRSLIL